MEENKFLIEKDLLEGLILSYIFSNMKVGYYGSNGFAYLERDSNNEISVKLDYKVSKEDETFNKKITISLVPKNIYTRADCIKLANEMYLRSENVAAFILKILKPNAKFE